MQHLLTVDSPHALCNHHILTSGVSVASEAVQLRHSHFEARRQKKKKKSRRDKKVEPVAHEINCPNYNKVWLLVSVRGRQFIFITIS